MAKKSKKSKKSLSSPILYILIGALLAVFRSQMISWAMTIAGIVFIVMGIIDLSKRRTLSGVANLVIGIAILVLGWTLAGIVLLVLGVLIAVKGFIDLLDVLKLPKKKRGFLKFIFPILTVIVGIALAFGNGLDYLILAVGVILIVDGLLGLIGSK